MRRIKKRDLGRNHYDKSQKVQPEEQIDELVDVDGSPIEGDRNPVADSEIEVDPGQTTDDFVASAIQPRRDFFGVYGNPYSRGNVHTTMESERKAKQLLSSILKESKRK